MTTLGFQFHIHYAGFHYLLPCGFACESFEHKPEQCTKNPDFQLPNPTAEKELADFLRESTDAAAQLAAMLKQPSRTAVTLDGYIRKGIV